LARGLAGGYSLRVAPRGDFVAFDRSRCLPSTVGELDTVDVRTGAHRIVLSRPGQYFRLAGWSPDGRWLLFWAERECSASIAADGLPLEAVPAAGGAPVAVLPRMLHYDDFLTWCGQALIAAAGSSRETNLGSALVRSGPPRWRERTLRRARRLSWVSPSCSPGGRRLAAAAGPSSGRSVFGSEHRSIWLLRPGGAVIRRLTLPPAPGLSDEAPRFSRDGRWIMFVRSHVLSGDASRDTVELVRTSGVGGAVPIVDFTSDDISFYDHFDWPSEIDWSQQAR
jgi:hypothetical protein